MFGHDYCYHDWEIIKDKTLKSPYEQLNQKINSIKRGAEIMFRKKSITILQCIKCGKLNKTIETNP